MVGGGGVGGWRVVRLTESEATPVLLSSNSVLTTRSVLSTPFDYVLFCFFGF